MPNAVKMLKDDHKKVQDLFKRFEKTDDMEEKREIVEETLIDLQVHTLLEEELFYPAARRAIGEDELIDEAEEEHHVAEMLIEELKEMRPNDSHYSAKFLVLAESVRHHIKEEESEMLPKAEEALGREELEDLGEKMTGRKEEAMEEMRAQMAGASGRSRRSR